ncbi:hypothetical protein RI129_001535 [Pyrocoelia pectoralis]|uniref:Uncharacterized protein n=1 Tax=Pyrocoelia pectoralis TaxID=417401 RepID=A0AAN7VV00_9COLE
MPDSSLLTDNIVAYISGFVVRMAKKKLKCIECILALESISDSFMDDSCMQLINRKTKGGLPSKNVFTICLHAEKQIRCMLHLSNNKLPRDDNFFELFILGTSMALISKENIFLSLNDHSLAESSIMDETHRVLLMKLIVRCYCRIRWFSVAKRQTEATRGELVRKTYSKLILFHNQ